MRFILIQLAIAATISSTVSLAGPASKAFSLKWQFGAGADNDDGRGGHDRSGSDNHGSADNDNHTYDDNLAGQPPANHSAGMPGARLQQRGSQQDRPRCHLDLRQ